MSDQVMSAVPPDRLASTSRAKVEDRALYNVTACYANPVEILKSPKLSTQQKRELLCKWALDAYRVESPQRAVYRHARLRGSMRLSTR